MDKKTLNERVSWLVNTSVQDLHSSLHFYNSKSADDMEILKSALATCKRRGEKTKAKLLDSKMRKMERDAAKERRLRLIQQAYD